MAEWTNIKPPAVDSTLGDHEVKRKGNHLEGKRIALLTTGSIAAITVPSLARELRKYGADVQIFATQDAIKCGVNLTALEWGSWPNPVVTELTSASEHLSLGNPFDLYLVAPATANTICKTAAGISDTVVTGALASALGRGVSVMMVPAMHGSLHNDFLREAVMKLKGHGVYFVAPFDAYGKHNMQDKQVIVMDVCRMLSNSTLKSQKIMVTAGPTPVKIDSVRRITNRFSGKLGILIAEELYRRGAEVLLYQAYSGMRPPRYVPHILFDDYEEYRQLMLEDAHAWDYGVFSAAVADYKPAVVLPGKTPSKGAMRNIELVETDKVIDEVMKLEKHPIMVTFKYEEGKGYDGLAKIAKERLGKGHAIVVATDGLDTDNGVQKAHIFSLFEDDVVAAKKDLSGKPTIARTLADVMEADLNRRAWGT